MHHHYQSHDTVYVYLQKCLYIYVYYKSECWCYCENGHVHRVELQGIILNVHGVAVSVVNNDASTSLVYNVCCCSVSARQLSCCEI